MRSISRIPTAKAAAIENFPRIVLQTYIECVKVAVLRDGRSTQSPYLYTLDVRLQDDAGEVLDGRSSRWVFVKSNALAGLFT